MYIETQLEKIVKNKFYGLSNIDLINRINAAADFKWDDEACELGRRMNKSEGKFICQMQGNRVVIIKDEKL